MVEANRQLQQRLEEEKAVGLQETENKKENEKLREELKQLSGVLTEEQ